MSELKVGLWLVGGSLVVLGVAGAVVAFSPASGQGAEDSGNSASVRRFAAQRAGMVEQLGGAVSSPPELVAGLLRDALQSLVRGDLGSLNEPGVEQKLEAILELRGWGDAQARSRAALLMLSEIKGASGSKRPGPHKTVLSSVQLRAIAVVASRLAQRLVNNDGDGEAKPGNIEDLKVPIADGFTRVHWQALGGFAYVPGQAIPAEVAELNGHPIALVGYMLPVAETRGAKTFLLVESLWGCCFGSVPEMNQVIDVRVAEEQGVDYRSDPVVVTGVLEVGEELEEEAVISLFRLQGAVVTTLGG